MRKVQTTKQFIEHLQKLYGDKYDYSKVSLIDWKTKVEIICPEHGSFFKMPGDLMSKNGNCPKCNRIKNGKSQQLDTDEFIKRAKAVHGDKYNYEKVLYNGLESKVCIICPKHGEFWQKANDHINKKAGCPKCATENNSEKRRTSKAEFIRRANLVHKNKYDYSKTEFKRLSDKATITCPVHGEFEQCLASHLHGFGCPKCSGHFKLGTSEFIKRAKEVHGNLYDYSEVCYKNTDVKVKIICKKHGAFEQTPHNHLRGHGCPICKTSFGEKLIHKILKEMKVSYTWQYEQPKLIKNTNPFIIDFYINKNNKDYYIEYNGIQHFQPVEYFGGEEKLIVQMERDEQLRLFCKENGIDLLEIPYYMNEEEISDKINKFLNDD